MERAGGKFPAMLLCSLMYLTICWPGNAPGNESAAVKTAEVRIPHDSGSHADEVAESDATDVHSPSAIGFGLRSPPAAGPDQEFEISVSELFFAVSSSYVYQLRPSDLTVITKAGGDMSGLRVACKVALTRKERQEWNTFLAEFPLDELMSEYRPADGDRVLDGKEITFSIRIGNNPPRVIVLENTFQPDLAALSDRLATLVPTDCIPHPLAMRIAEEPDLGYEVKVKDWFPSMGGGYEYQLRANTGILEVHRIHFEHPSHRICTARLSNLQRKNTAILINQFPLDSSAPEYLNELVDDGRQLTFFIRRGREAARTIRLENMYQNDLAILANHLALLVPKSCEDEAPELSLKPASRETCILKRRAVEARIEESRNKRCISNDDCVYVAGIGWGCRPVGHREYLEEIQQLSDQFLNAGCIISPPVCPEDHFYGQPACVNNYCVKTIDAENQPR